LRRVAQKYGSGGGRGLGRHARDFARLASDARGGKADVVWLWEGLSAPTCRGINPLRHSRRRVEETFR
jgi:hypothetical protein